MPFGEADSIAYKSLDGKIIFDGEEFAKGDPYKAGDVIGMAVNISSPRKYP